MPEQRPFGSKQLRKLAKGYRDWSRREVDAAVIKSLRDISADLDAKADQLR